MCLAIPMKIKKIKNKNKAIAILSKVEREINISLVENINIGDYVMVHAGKERKKI